MTPANLDTVGGVAIGQQVTPPAVQAPGLARRAGRWAWLSLRLVALWWPIAPVWLLALAGGPLVGGLVALMVLDLWLVWPWYRRQFDRAADASYHLFWSAAWPKVAANAGLVLALDGHARAPRLLDVQRGPGLVPVWTRLTIRPLGPQEPATWPKIEDRLRRVTGHQTSLSWESPGGDLVVTLRQVRLPWPAPAPIDQLGEQEDVVRFGESAGGGPFGWHIDQNERAHAIIAGPPGGGKGGAARLLLAHAVRHRWQIIVINPKRSGEFTWVKPAASIVKTRPGIFLAIQRAHELMEQRQDLIEAAGADSWRQVPGLTHRVLVVIDEMAVLAGMRGTTRAEQDLWRKMMTELEAMAAMARSAGVHVVFMTQHPTAEAFGPNGSTVKSVCLARIGTGQLNTDGIRMMFGAEVAPTLAAALSAGQSGRCLYQGLDGADGGRTTAGQIWWAEQADLAPLLPADHPTPPDYDAEAAELIEAARTAAAEQDDDGGGERRGRSRRRAA